MLPLELPAFLRIAPPNWNVTMRTAFLFFAILLVCVPTHCAQTEYKDAKSALRDANKADDVDSIIGFLDIVSECQDERIIKELRRAADKKAKLAGRLNDKIISKGQEVAKVWKSIDKQADAGRPVTVGTAESVMKKFQVIQQDLNEMLSERRVMDAFVRRCRAGAAEVLRSLPFEKQTEYIESLTKDAANSSKVEDQLEAITILASSECEPARLALVGLLSTHSDGAVRTAVANGLARSPQPENAKVLGAALSDEVWTVRVACLEGLRGILHPSAIEEMIAFFPKAHGRTLEDLILALELRVGRTFHDNATLWQSWWKDHGDTLKEVWKEIHEDDMMSRLQGISRATKTENGLLAYLLMDLHGLGPTVQEDGEIEPLVSDEADSEAIRRASQDAVGQILSTRPLRIRNRMLRHLIVEPFRRSKKLTTRLSYLDWCAFIDSPALLDLLKANASSEPLRDPQTGSRYDQASRKKLRLSAVRALARHSSPEATQILDAILTGDQGDVETRVATAKALAAQKTKEGTYSLIQGLRTRDDEVKTACRDGLITLTGKSFDPDYSAWIAWWRGIKGEFKPMGAVDPTEEQEKVAAKESGTEFYGIESRSEHLVFILDRSGSMQEPEESGKKKIDRARDELIKAITALKDGTTFNIIFYNSSFDQWNKGMTVVNGKTRKAAIKWVKEIEAVGSTNIFDPLERAFELAGRGTHDSAYKIMVDTIYFMSDGLANRGRIINTVDILREIRKVNELQKVKIHTIGIGKGHDVSLMKGLATMSGGTYIAP